MVKVNTIKGAMLALCLGVSVLAYSGNVNAQQRQQQPGSTSDVGETAQNNVTVGQIQEAKAKTSDAKATAETKAAQQDAAQTRLTNAQTKLTNAQAKANADKAKIND